MHVKSQSCIVLFDLFLQQLPVYSILGQPSYFLALGTGVSFIAGKLTAIQRQILGASFPFYFLYHFSRKFSFFISVFY